MPDKKFLFVSIDGLIADIACHVLKEGHPVKLFVESESERESPTASVPKTRTDTPTVAWVSSLELASGPGGKTPSRRSTRVLPQ